MKRILVFSPVRGGLPTDYVRSLIALLNSSLNKGPNAKYAIDFAWTMGTSVAMARDEGANLFLQRGDDELVSWDVDLGSKDIPYMLAMFERLLSHDVDIVGGAYVGHNFNSQWHGAAANPDAKMREDGLLPMAQIPLGFSKVKRRVFEGIKKNRPDLEYVFRETQMEKAKPNMFEFYPNGIVGPNTGQGKVERIKALLGATVGNLDSAWKLLNEVKEIIEDADYSQSVMLGEDFYFCKLARDAGFEMFIDNNLIVPHESGVRLPVNNQKILSELSQEWRLHNDAKPEQVAELLKQMSPLLNQQIP